MEDPGNKAAKKNQRRRAAAKKSQEQTETVIETDSCIEKPVPFDPISDLKLKIEEAKAVKDHDLAQKLRQELWVLQDTVQLGRAGPGAPQVDVSSMMSPQKPQVSTSEGASLTASSDPTEKKIGKLKKKLQQIDGLKQRQANGEKLEVNQLTKIQTESDIQEEIALLQSLLQSNQLR